MKVALISLAIITAASGLVQPAMAQGARFSFAPNNYSTEQQNKPRWNTTPNAPYVPQGAVPKNMLGIDPGFISRPAPPQPRQIVVPRIAPIAQTSTQATPSFTTAVPKNIPAALPPAFQARFGNPISTPPVVAMQPTAPTGQTAPAKSDAAKPSSKPAAHHVGTGVSGHLVRPRVQTGQAAHPAQGLPPIASYGGTGYKSGTYLPSVGGGTGISSSSSLSGTLLTPQRHHH